MTRVLTIEDDEATRRDILAKLARHDLDADWTADSHEGLQRALSEPYDVITLDRMLPGLPSGPSGRSSRARLNPAAAHQGRTKAIL